MTKKITKKDLLKKTVKHIDITSFDSRNIIKQMNEMSFTSRDLGNATEIFNMMLKDQKCSIILFFEIFFFEKLYTFILFHSYYVEDGKLSSKYVHPIYPPLAHKSSPCASVFCCVTHTGNVGSVVN